MPEYDATRFSPPAPVASVALRNPQTNAELADQLLLIDTGADTTLIPIAALATLGMQPIANVNYEVIAFDGSKSVASVADLDLIFLNRRFRGRYPPPSSLLRDIRTILLGGPQHFFFNVSLSFRRAVQSVWRERSIWSSSFSSRRVMSGLSSTMCSICSR
jgi:hypothetical protein